jgi:hypothetical protein
MAAEPGQDRTLAPLPAPGVAASLKLFLLRFAPLVLEIAVEPWIVAATAVGLLRRKLKGSTSEQPLGYVTADAADARRQVMTGATWLLGVCVIIIVALKVTDQNARTWSDEAARVAAGFMAVSIVLSRSSGKTIDSERVWRSGLSDWSFLIGCVGVLASLLFSLSLL